MVVYVGGQVETKEAIPLYFGRSDPMMEKLSEKVATISDEMRSKVRLSCESGASAGCFLHDVKLGGLGGLGILWGS